MRMHSSRFENERGYVDYRFTLYIDDSDINVNGVNEDDLAFIRSKVRRTIIAKHGFNDSVANTVYPVTGTNKPVYYIDQSDLFMAVAFNLENGDPLRGIPDVRNPEYATYMRLMDKMNLWALLKISPVNRIMNGDFFSGDYHKGSPERDFTICKDGMRSWLVEESPITPREQPVETPVETAVANPVESPVEPVTEGEFPLTMAQVSRKVSPFGGKLKSKYEFGQFAIKKPRGVPSLERALREYTRHHVYAIARALILRKYGLTVTKDEVFEAAKNSFKTYSNTAPYRDVIKEHREDPSVSKAGENVANIYGKIMDGVVDLDWKKFRKNDTYGKPWDIGSFFIYMTDGLHISPKAISKRKSKKQKERKHEEKQ